MIFQLLLWIFYNILIYWFIELSTTVLVNNFIFHHVHNFSKNSSRIAGKKEEVELGSVKGDGDARSFILNPDDADDRIQESRKICNLIHILKLFFNLESTNFKGFRVRLKNYEH